jgi:hypothetical protein
MSDAGVAAVSLVLCGSISTRCHSLNADDNQGFLDAARAGHTDVDNVFFFFLLQIYYLKWAECLIAFLLYLRVVSSFIRFLMSLQP